VVDSNPRETLCQFDNGDKVGWRWQVLTDSAERTSLLFIWLFTLWSRVHLYIRGRDSCMFLVNVSGTDVATG
jgi:hypothetical protein